MRKETTAYRLVKSTLKDLNHQVNSLYERLLLLFKLLDYFIIDQVYLEKNLNDLNHRNLLQQVFQKTKFSYLF